MFVLHSLVFAFQVLQSTIQRMVASLAWKDVLQGNLLHWELFIFFLTLRLKKKLSFNFNLVHLQTVARGEEVKVKEEDSEFIVSSYNKPLLETFFYRAVHKTTCWYSRGIWPDAARYAIRKKQIERVFALCLCEKWKARIWGKKGGITAQ